MTQRTKSIVIALLIFASFPVFQGEPEPAAILGIPPLLRAQAAIEAPEAAQLAPFINGSLGQVKIAHQLNGGPTLANGDAFGSAIAATDINKDGRIDLLIGAPGDDTGGSNRGAVYVGFRGITSTLTGTTKLANGLNGTPVLANEDAFGGSVTAIGDLNGDTIQDIVIGAPGDDTGGSNRGAVYVCFMRADGTISTTVKIAHQLNGGPTLSNSVRFGAGVGTIGDLNGDGITDIAIGAPGTVVTSTQVAGMGLYIAFMRANGTVSQTVLHSGNALSLTAGAFSLFGAAVSGVGDFNGDGIPDVAVSAPGEGFGQVFQLMLRHDGTYSTSLKLNPLQSAVGYGTGLAGMGDVNGDGIPDLAGGNPNDLGGTGTARGNMTMYEFQRNGTVSNSVSIGYPIAHTSGPLLNLNDRYGTALASLGDIDGDLNRDIAIGATGDDSGGTDRGAVYITRLGGLFADAVAAVAVNAPVITVGQRVTFTMVISNQGQLYSNLNFSLPIPTALTAITYTFSHPTPQSFAESGLPKYRFIAPLGPNQRTTIIMSGLAGANMLNQTYTSTASVSSQTVESDTLNNSATVTFSVAAQPIAGLQALNSSVTRLGDATRFTASVSSGSGVTYTWSFGDGNVGQGAAFTHTYAAAGRYTVIVTASNAAGVQVAQTLANVQVPLSGLSMQVNPLLQEDVNAVFDGLLVAGSEPVFTWDFGDGSSGSGASVNKTFDPGGDYTVRLVASNGLGQLEVTRTVRVYMPISGLALTGGSPSLRARQPITIQAGIAHGNFVSYAWDFGDGSVGAGAGVTHTFATGGSYTLTVTATNALGSQVLTFPFEIIGLQSVFLPAVTR